MDLFSLKLFFGTAPAKLDRAGFCNYFLVFCFSSILSSALRDFSFSTALQTTSYSAAKKSLARSSPWSWTQNGDGVLWECGVLWLWGAFIYIGKALEGV
jgi:hypothetical protein